MESQPETSISALEWKIFNVIKISNIMKKSDKLFFFPFASCCSFLYMTVGCPRACWSLDPGWLLLAILALLTPLTTLCWNRRLSFQCTSSLVYATLHLSTLAIIWHPTSLEPLKANWFSVKDQLDFKRRFRILLCLLLHEEISPFILF